MPNRIHVAFVAGLLAIASFGIAQTNQTTSVKIKTVPIRNTSPASGQQMYANYCAVCHGANGKGNGPAAAAMKVQPTDLTTLTRGNRGVFPDDHIYSVLRFGIDIPAHGNQGMPVWGPALRSLDSGTMASSIEQQRIVNLTHYLRSLQQR